MQQLHFLKVVRLRAVAADGAQATRRQHAAPISYLTVIEEQCSGWCSRNIARLAVGPQRAA